MSYPAENVVCSPVTITQRASRRGIVEAKPSRIPSSRAPRLPGLEIVSRATWGAGCVIAASAYLAFRLAGPSPSLASRAVESGLFSAFCLTALVAGVALFRARIDGAERAWRTLAANSFGIYYVHPLILYPLAYLLVGLSVPAIAKFSILVVATLVGSLAVSGLVLKQVPGLRRMF